MGLLLVLFLSILSSTLSYTGELTNYELSFMYIAMGALWLLKLIFFFYAIQHKLYNWENLKQWFINNKEGAIVGALIGILTTHYIQLLSSTIFRFLSYPVLVAQTYTNLTWVWYVMSISTYVALGMLVDYLIKKNK